MVTEDYVSFETAKLLKEKGFDEATNGYYPIVGKAKETFHKGAAYRWNYFSDRGIAAPALSMVMKWLRDTFHLEIYPFHDAIQENNDWWYRIERHSKGCGLTKHESDVIYKTYEEACESAIKYCLENLI